MYSTSQQIVLTDEEREGLMTRSRARSLRASDAQRARLILLLADGFPTARWPRSWTAVRPRSASGDSASWSRVWKGSMGDIKAVAGLRRRSVWKSGFWP